MSTCNKCPRQTSNALCLQCELEERGGMDCCPDCKAMIQQGISECPDCGSTEVTA